jgi:hypothetical protein
MLGCPSHQSQGGRRTKLHGNAALSLNKRRPLARRVVGEEWSLSAAAAAAALSENTAHKSVRRFRAAGEASLLDRPSAPRSVHNATPEDRVHGDRGAQAAAVHGAGDRRAAEDGHLDGRRAPEADRAGQALPPRAAEADPPLREAAHRRTVHIDVKTLGRIPAKGAGQRITSARGRDRTRVRRHERGKPRNATAGSTSECALTRDPAWPSPRRSTTRAPPARSPSRVAAYVGVFALAGAG